jgi:mediator of RNA polymerase II transcription subunit 10
MQAIKGNYNWAESFNRLNDLSKMDSNDNPDQFPTGLNIQEQLELYLSPDKRYVENVEKTLQSAMETLAHLADVVINFGDDSLPALSTSMETLSSQLASIDKLSLNALNSVKNDKCAVEGEINGGLGKKCDNGKKSSADTCDQIADVWIPKKVIDTLDLGQNPRIVTKDYMERLSAENQFTHGKNKAAETFHQVLEQNLALSFPEVSNAIPNMSMDQQFGRS